MTDLRQLIENILRKYSDTWDFEYVHVDRFKLVSEEIVKLLYDLDYHSDLVCR